MSELQIHLWAAPSRHLGHYGYREDGGGGEVEPEAAGCVGGQQGEPHVIKAGLQHGRQ